MSPQTTINRLEQPIAKSNTPTTNHKPLNTSKRVQRVKRTQPDKPDELEKPEEPFQIITDADLEAAGWPPLPEFKTHKPAKEKSRHAARATRDVWRIRCCRIDLIEGRPQITSHCSLRHQEECLVRLFLQTLAWSDETYEEPPRQPPSLNFPVFPEPNNPLASSPSAHLTRGPSDEKTRTLKLKNSRTLSPKGKSK